jgi:CheY-like chemotaxis protein
MSPQPITDPAGARMEPAKQRVLLVDDDPLNRKLSERCLRGAGFAVETASDAEVAMKMALEVPPDAIVSDVQMPGMNGFELREAMQRDARLAKIPVILISAAHVENTGRPGLAVPAGVCVARSPDLHEAIEALEVALGREPPTSR